MYEKRYSLKRRPFPTTPDGSVYYPATEHEANLALLQGALTANEGYILLTGTAGTGKTLLSVLLLERLENSCVSGVLTNSHFCDRRGLLQAILYDLGLPYETGSEQELRLKLTEFLLKNCQEGKKTLLVIDEAQNSVGRSSRGTAASGQPGGRARKSRADYPAGPAEFARYATSTGSLGPAATAGAAAEFAGPGRGGIPRLPAAPPATIRGGPAGARLR